MKERAQAGLRRPLASDPGMRSSARRAGSGSSSAAAGDGLPGLTRPRCVRVGPSMRPLIPPSPTPGTQASLPPPPAASRRRTRGGRRGAFAMPRSARCGACVSRTFANPPVGGPSAIRETATSPIAGSRRSEANPIAPVTAGWLTGPRTRDRPYEGDKEFRPSRVHEPFCEDGRYTVSICSNTQIWPGAFRPASRRVEADWMKSGRKPALCAVVST